MKKTTAKSLTTLILLLIASALTASLIVAALINRAAETPSHLWLRLKTATAQKIIPPEALPDRPQNALALPPGGTGTDNQSEPVFSFSRPQELSRLVEIKESPYWSILNEGQLANTESWQTIFVQNKSKLEYTIIPQSSRDWELIQERRKVKIRFRSEVDVMKDILSRKKRGKYAIQLFSLSEDEIPKVMSLLRLLMNDGHYTYLYRSSVKFEGKYWYRLRVGFFKNVEESMEIGNEIAQKYKNSGLFPKKHWTVFPSSRELSREIIDLQQPITKSWIIELPLYRSKEDAIRELILFSLNTNFAYISQKRGLENDSIQYRIRVGFFEADTQAKKKLRQLAKKHKIFRRASVLRL